jgi:transcription elongation factor GreA
MSTKLPMTKDGFTNLEVELKHLKSVERPALARAISEAREHGDLSENAEYHAAKERQAWVETRVKEIQDKLARAQIIDISTLSGDRVMFGATVVVADNESGEEATYQIVGADEADIRKGRLSITAPLARALIGKGPGDTVEVHAPSGDRSYEIIAVEFR